MASIQIRGIQELIERVGMAQAARILRPPMTRSMARVVNRMGDYPPQPPTPYRRTGTLGRSWTQEVTETAESVEGKVGSNTSYGPFVQSEQFQAHWMDHWQTDQDVISELEPTILADFDQVIGEVLNG